MQTSLAIDRKGQRMVAERDRRRASEMLLRSNPLLGLSVAQAQGLYDAARIAHGSSPLLQRVYAEIESVDPVLLTCVERRAAALSGMGWSIEVDAGADGAEADAQRSAAEAFISGVENLDEAIEHLGGAFFRGYSFAQPVWQGCEVRTITPINSWNALWSDGVWYWNPDCQPTADGLEEIGDDVLRVRCARAIDYPALFIYLRHSLTERDWGRYVERYGIPPVDAIMSDAATEQDRPVYEDAADAARDGVSVVWPAGTNVSRADSSRGSDPFSAIIDHQEKLLVLMATGGTLTSLAQSDTGTLAGNAQMDVWKQIVSRIATVIAGSIHRGLLLPFLARCFPGRNPLVRFSLGKSADPTPAELIDIAAKAKAAGYVLQQEELESGTGYKFERDQAAPDGGMGGGFGGFAANADANGLPFARKPVATLLQNARNASDVENYTEGDGGHQSADLGVLAEEALRRDLDPVLSKISALADLPDAEARKRASAILDELDKNHPHSTSLSNVMELSMAAAVAGGRI